MKRTTSGALFVITLAGIFILQGCLGSLRRADTLGDEAAKSIRYIATEKQQRALKKLDNREEIERFLHDFWVSVDPTPDTPKNEMKEEYDRRCQFADDNFSEMKVPGSLTDRGRIYVINGPPAEIYLRPMLREDFEEILGVQGDRVLIPELDREKESLPRLKPDFKRFDDVALRVWEYDLPASRAQTASLFSGFAASKLTFIFADMEGYGGYTLVYSTSGKELDDTRMMFGPFATGRIGLNSIGN